MRCGAATISGPGPTTLRGRAAAGRAFVLAVALVCHASPAAAGPWARGEGDVFLSFGMSTEDTRTALLLEGWEPQRTFSIYGEYGLGHRFTGGIDLDWGELSRMGVLFVRRTLTPSDTRFQLAVDAGVGLRQQDGEDSETRLRLGASAGMGFGAWDGEVGAVALAHEGGWISVDAVALMDPEGDLDPILSYDLTVGLNFSERLAGILSVTAEDWPDAEMLIAVRPSLVFALTERTRLQTGAHAAIEGAETLGLTFSIWQEF